MNCKFCKNKMVSRKRQYDNKTAYVYCGSCKYLLNKRTLKWWCFYFDLNDNGLELPYRTSCVEFNKKSNDTCFYGENWKIISCSAYNNYYELFPSGAHEMYKELYSKYKRMAILR